MPLSSSVWSTYGSYSSGIQSKYPVRSTEYHNNDPFYWQQENINLAHVVYDTVKPNTALSSSYVAQAVATSEKRMSFGGRRLANMIKDIYGANEADVMDE